MDMEMRDFVILCVVTGAIVLLVAAAVIVATKRSANKGRTAELRKRFGEEYDVTIARLGRRSGEEELRERMRRFRGMELDRLSPDAREDLTDRWKEAQYRFLEDPHYSVREAEHLVATLMRERGYPDGDFDTRVRAVSVEQPRLAEPYRAAYSTFRSAEDGNAAVNEMFEAMLGYRSLFEALIERPKREAGVKGSSPPDSDFVPSSASSYENENGNI
jgi:hypothetical protein